MLRDQGLIRFLIEDLPFGGLLLWTELMCILGSRCNWILLVFLCMVRFLPWRSLWFRFSERIYGRKSMNLLLWICVRYLIWNLSLWISKLCKKRLFIPENLIKWTLLVLIFCCLLPLNGLFLSLLCCMRLETPMMEPLLLSIG